MGQCEFFHSSIEKCDLQEFPCRRSSTCKHFNSFNFKMSQFLGHLLRLALSLALRVDSSADFGSTRGQLVSLLSRFDQSGSLLSLLPSVNSLLQLGSENFHGTASGPTQARRRSAHPPCECPEMLDALSTNCLDKRLELTKAMLTTASEPAPGVQASMNLLRMGFGNFSEALRKESNSTTVLMRQMYEGNGKFPGYIPQTRTFSDILRRVAETMTQCVSSLWMQEFQVYDLTETQFQKLEGKVTRVVSNITDWFSAMQRQEEELTSANMFRIVQDANQALGGNVAQMNYFLKKLYDSVTALDTNYETHIEQADTLKSALEQAADQVDDNVHEFPVKVIEMLRNTRERMQDQAMQRTLAEFDLYVRSLIGKLQANSAAKTAVLLKSSTAVIRKQDKDAKVKVLDAAVNVSQALIDQTDQKADDMRDQIASLKAKLDKAMDQSLQAATERVKNEFINKQKPAIDDIELTVSKINTGLDSQRTDEARLLSQLASDKAAVEAQVNSDIDEMLRSITHGKNMETLQQAQTEAASSEQAVTTTMNEEDAALQGHIIQTMEDIMFDENEAAGGQLAAGHGLDLTVSGFDNDFSSAAEAVRSGQSDAMNDVLGTAMTGLADNMSGPVDTSAAVNLVKQQRDRAGMQTTLVARKTNANAAMQLTAADGRARALVQTIQQSSLSAAEKQKRTRQVMTKVAARRAQFQPIKTDANIRNAMAATATAVAASEDALLSVLDKTGFKFQDSLESSVQSALAKLPPLPVLGVAGNSVLPAMKEQYDAMVSERLADAERMDDALTETKQDISQSLMDMQTFVREKTGGIAEATPRARIAALLAAASNAQKATKFADHNTVVIRQMSDEARASAIRLATQQLERIRAGVVSTNDFARRLKQFIDAAQPDLTKSREDFKVRTNAFSSFFKRKDQQVAKSAGQVDQLLLNWSDSFDTFKASLADNQSFIADRLDSVLSETMSAISSKPGALNESIQDLIDVFEQGVDVVQTEVRNVTAAVNTVSANVSSNASQTALQVANATMDVHSRLKELMAKNQQFLIDKRARMAPLALAGNFSTRTRALIASRAKLAVDAKNIVSAQANWIQALVKQSAAEINATLAEAAAQVARNKSVNRLYAAMSNKELLQVDSFIKRIDSDIDRTLKDYKGAVDLETKRALKTPERIFDELVAIKSEASGMIARVAQTAADSTSNIIQRNFSQPGLIMGLMRRQIAGVNKVFGSYLKATGREGLFKEAEAFHQESAETTLVQMLTHLHEAAHSLNVTDEEITGLVAEVAASANELATAGAEVDAKQADMQTEIQQWYQTQMSAVQSDLSEVAEINGTLPDIQTVVMNAIKGLVSNIENSVTKGLTPATAANLTTTLDQYITSLSAPTPE